METIDKLKSFDKLVNNYVEIINCILDMAIRNNLLPMRILITVPFLREYIEKNKITLLEHGVIYLLKNKDEILNFSMEKLEQLDELDDDADDNVSRKECSTNISKLKDNLNNLGNEIKSIDNNEILNLIIEIKNNSKKLDKENIELIRNYIKLLIYVLEEIKKLCLN